MCIDCLWIFSFLRLQNVNNESGGMTSTQMQPLNQTSPTAPDKVPARNAAGSDHSSNAFHC